YLGKVYGFSDELLCRAAGYAQVKAGTSNPNWGTYTGNPPYGDDPKDQENIKLGISYYEKLNN
ncbi:polymorphic toxin type 44 domain-containing protein, partial [Clostridium tyrobutyricum]